MTMKEKKGKAVIVGGSIAGVSCALSLISAGWNVVVLEKSSAPPSRRPTGAGIGLDPQSLRIIQSWLPLPHLLLHSTLPLSIDESRAINGERKVSKVLGRDESYNFRAIHWADLHSLLYHSLPPDIFLWGHTFLSFSVSQHTETPVNVKAKLLQTQHTIELDADLLVAADGSRSSIRKAFFPDLKLRYSGYYALRGVIDFSREEDTEFMLGIRRAYPDLGDCLYFDLAAGNHCALFELPNKRLNWLWYVNGPEPQFKGNSVTVKPSSATIKRLYQEADRIWIPEMAKLMKETKDPFVNAIYDCDPLERVAWDNVVLVGEAAHPITPHHARSTNMSIVDAHVLGECLRKWGGGDGGLAMALREYQSFRQCVTPEQVLSSRRVGRIRQGLSVPGRVPFDPEKAGPDECKEIMQRHMPFFSGVPVLELSLKPRL